MPRVTISLRKETADDVSALAHSLGCSRSALVDIILSRGLLKHLTARMDFLNMQVDPQGGPVKRLRGSSIRELSLIHI